MITPPYLRTMTAYNAEMNRRWYTAAETLTAHIVLLTFLWIT